MAGMTFGIHHLPVSDGLRSIKLPLTTIIGDVSKISGLAAEIWSAPIECQSVASCPCVSMATENV